MLKLCADDILIFTLYAIFSLFVCFAYFAVVVSEEFVGAMKLLFGASSLSDFRLSYFQHLHFCKCSPFIFVFLVL